MVKFVLIIIITFTLFTSVPINATIHSAEVYVNLDQTTLRESIEDLSQIFEIQIALFCNNKKLPQKKFSFNLEKATLEQSIKEVLRRAKIQNHVLFYDEKKNTLTVWILSFQTREVTSSNTRNNILFESKSEPLTFDQMILLAQNSQEPSDTVDKPLTSEQMNQLLEQHFEIEGETDELAEPLTQEQLYQLQRQSLWIEKELEEGQNPLTSEEMEQLRKYPVEIKFDNERNLQPLSREQMFLLKQQKHEV